jgi:Zn-dependent metalloprotease
MKRSLLIVVIALMIGLVGVQVGSPITAQSSSALNQLHEDAESDLTIVWNPQSNTPSFISGSIPVQSLVAQSNPDAESIALGFASSYAGLFGLQDVSRELRVTASETDDLGMEHVTLQQLYRGVPVYHSIMKVHIDEQQVVAASSGLVPGLQMISTEPTITAADAIAVAQKVTPDGIPAGVPELVVYPGDNQLPLQTARLVWIVTMHTPDGIPDRYIVDATEPFLLDIIEGLSQGLAPQPFAPLATAPFPATLAHNALYQVDGQQLQAISPPIATYDSQGKKQFPTKPVRVGNDPPVGQKDVDQAHEFTQETFEYYRDVHGRNSFDNRGAITHSTVNFGTNYVNAFWDGRNKRISYGTSLAVEDVVAHEWTHAVTQHTANLEYRWQSGALNESFSDIFAAMVDREDWLIGEDIPSRLIGGLDALRSMSNPEKYGDPAHTNDWKQTCQDHEGVHTNNSIVNKAYYLIATQIGKDKAELIFYRVLATYLQVDSSFQDARAAALQATADLYGKTGNEYKWVAQGFDKVGITASWSPPANNCGCAATQLLAERKLFPNPLNALNIAATLYQVRSDVLSGQVAGEHYRSLYEEHSARISKLLFADAELRSQAVHVLTAVQPGLQSLVDPDAEEARITQNDVQDLTGMLQDLAEADRADGGGDLANTIEAELARRDLNALVGMTYAEARDYLVSEPANRSFLPLVLR